MARVKVLLVAEFEELDGADLGQAASDAARFLERVGNEGLKDLKVERVMRGIGLSSVLLDHGIEVAP